MTHPSSLRVRAQSGIAWTLLARGGQQCIQLIVGIVLARNLDPQDFGLIGSLTVFIALSQILADGGFSKALIQSRDTDRRDESSLFFFNLTASVLLWGALWLVARWVAWFFRHQPRSSELIILLRVLGIGMVFSAAGTIQTTLLTKAMDFRRLTWIGLSAACIAGLVAVPMALVGGGVWSLVANIVLFQFFTTSLLWLSSSWRPWWTLH